MFVEIKTEDSLIRIPFKTLSIHLPKAAPVSLLSNENETIISTLPVIEISQSTEEIPQTNTSFAEIPIEKSEHELTPQVNVEPEPNRSISESESLVVSVAAPVAPENTSSEDSEDSELDMELEESQVQVDGNKSKVLSAKQQERLKLQQLRQEEKERKRLAKEELKKRKQQAIAEKKEANAAKKKEQNDKKGKEEEELKEYEGEVKQLNDAGFCNNKQNLRLLKKHNKDVELVKTLINKKKAPVS